MLTVCITSSLVNNTSPDFAPGPYQPHHFPFSGACSQLEQILLAYGCSCADVLHLAESVHPERHLFQPNAAHFMALCMKLVYENEDLIKVRSDRLCGVCA